MDKIVQKSLRYSLWDGIFSSIMIGATETFIVPYALAMKAGPALVGMLVALPNLTGALLQTSSAALSEWLGSRKALIVFSVFMQAVMWIPVIMIPYAFDSHRGACLVLFYTILIAVGLLSFPPWASMMADYVPENQRGKVFGWRNRVFGVTNICAMLTSGLILQWSGMALGGAIRGFTVIFSLACLSRLSCCYFLARQHEPALEIKPEHKFTIFNFLRRIRRSNFGRFVIFVALINFAVFMSGPFFAVYMLKELGFSYITYTVITMASTLMIFTMMRLWGSHADHVGNRRVLRLTSFFLPAIPVLWLFSHNVAYLIAIQLFGGFFWAGFNMSASNFLFDAVTPEKRTRCIAYYNAVNGVAIFLGAASGGCLAKVLPHVGGSRLLALFLLSGLIRLAVLPICSTIREVRQVKHVSNLELFYSVMTARSPASLYSAR
jgi:MFS family permease